MQNIFSLPLIVDDLSSGEKHFSLKPTKEELKYIQEVLKVPDVKDFTADIRIKHSVKDHLLEVWGKVEATLTLESVVSLELFDQKHLVDFSLIYDTHMTRAEQKALEETRDDVPDIVTNGKIDLVDIAIEQLALDMDDYPRQPGEEFRFSTDFDATEPLVENPFKVLEKLKK